MVFLFSLGYHGCGGHNRLGQPQSSSGSRASAPSTSLLEECEALHAQMADAAAREHATRHSRTARPRWATLQAHMVAWLMGGVIWNTL